VHRQVGHEFLTPYAGVHVRVLAGPGRGTEVLEIEPRAETSPRTGDDRDPTVGVAPDYVQRVVQVGGECEVERVQPFWPVERDLLHTRCDIVDGDRLHGVTRPRGRG
jgi:hypothetical protein